MTRVETPEHFSFSFELAGPARRVVAYLIDLAVRGIIAVVVMTIGSIGGLFGFFSADGLAVGALFLLMFALEWGYFVLLELIWDGRSIGKRIQGLRVVSADGRPLSVGAVLLRNLLRAADFLPNLYALGFLIMAGDRKFRRLGDTVASTLVVYERRERIENELVIQPPPTPAELSQFPQWPKLNGRELEALEIFLRRMQMYPEARLIELADLIAPSYARRFGVRYRHPVRFLQLLYHRAARLPAPQWGGGPVPGPPGFPHRPGPPPQGAPRAAGS